MHAPDRELLACMHLDGHVGELRGRELLTCMHLGGEMLACMHLGGHKDAYCMHGLTCGGQLELPGTHNHTVTHDTRTHCTWARAGKPGRGNVGILGLCCVQKLPIC